MNLSSPETYTSVHGTETKFQSGLQNAFILCPNNRGDCILALNFIFTKLMSDKEILKVGTSFASWSTNSDNYLVGVCRREKVPGGTSLIKRNAH